MSNNLKKFRNEKGLSQEKLATIVKISRQSISNLERGKQVPSVYLSNRLAETLDTTSESLFPTQIVNNNVQGTKHSDKITASS